MTRCTSLAQTSTGRSGCHRYAPATRTAFWSLMCPSCDLRGCTGNFLSPKQPHVGCHLRAKNARQPHGIVSTNAPLIRCLNSKLWREYKRNKGSRKGFYNAFVRLSSLLRYTKLGPQMASTGDITLALALTPILYSRAEKCLSRFFLFRFRI